MQGSITHKTDTDPLINGASYLYTDPKGVEEYGIIMGARFNPLTKKMEGYMYAFGRGNIPQLVVEGTESLLPWKLYAVPSQMSAKKLVSALERERSKGAKEAKKKTEESQAA